MMDEVSVNRNQSRPCTREVRPAKFPGVVVLRFTITRDGRLDVESVKTASKWRFTPAIGPHGQPVAVVVPMEVTFRIPYGG
jgi:outer membrane biosynthesis protein TonB